jgi:hypothetical protein
LGPARSNYDRKKKDTVICPLLRRSKYDRKKKTIIRKKNKNLAGARLLLRPEKKVLVICLARKKKDTVVWPSFAAPFQLPLLVALFQLRPEKKKIQLSDSCYTIPIKTRKKRYSHLAIIRCAVPIAIVAPFQLRPEKKDTVVCPLLRHSNYDWEKKKIQLSGHHSLRRSNCHCCTVPITTGKKRYSRLSVVTPFQLRPEKKDTFVRLSFAAPFQLPLLVAPFQLQPEKKIQSSVRCYAIPITTGKKRYSRLAIICCAVPIAIVAPFQLREKKKSGGCAIVITTGKNKF